MRLTKSILLFSLLYVCHLAGRAQGVYSFTSDEGLSNTCVQSLYEDSRHNVWICTTNGLNQYDGAKFNVYSTDAPDGYALRSNFITHVKQMTDNTLLVGLNLGLQALDINSGRVENIPVIRSENDTVQAFVSSIERFRDGKLRIATAGYGIYRLERDGDGYRAVSDKELNAVANVQQVTEDSKGRTWWIDRSGKAYVRKAGSGQAVESMQLPSTGTRLRESASGNIYVGTEHGGLLRYNERRAAFERIAAVGTAYNIYRIVCRPDGLVYLCTDGDGLLVYDERTDKARQCDIKTNDYKLEASNVKDLLIDHYGTTWVGVYWKGVLAKPKDSSPFFYIGRRSAGRNTIGTNCVTALLADHDGTMWVATDNCGLYHINADGTESAHFREREGAGVTATPHIPPTIIGLFKDSEGTLWLGSSMGELALLNAKTGACTPVSRVIPGGGDMQYVYSVTEDTRKNVWIATNGRGLFCYNLTSKTLRHYEQSRPGSQTPATILTNAYINQVVARGAQLYLCTADGLEKLDVDTDGTPKASGRLLGGVAVYHVSIAADGSLWASTNEGLAHITVRGDDFAAADIRTMTKADGLPSNFVCATEIDAEGNVWISTLNGMALHKPRTGETQAYYAADGLQGNEFTAHACAALNGNIYFGGINGITYFRPSDVTATAKPSKPELRITDFFVNNQRVRAGQKSGSYTIMDTWVDETDELHLCHEDRTFSLELSTMTFNRQHTTYHYRVNGEDWRELQKGQNRISFINMPTGTYRIDIRAASYGRQSDTRTITVRIHPVWYASAWAWAVYALLFLLACYGAAQQVKERVKARRILQRHRREEEMNEARTQFFMNISHEIRTPMTLILSPLEKLMKSDNDPEARRRSYSLIHLNAQRILRLINQLMDARKIEKGQLHLRYSRAELVQFLQNLYELFDAAARQRHIAMEFRHEGIEQMPVCIDTQNFDKVVMNLLSNALKFTPDGGRITIALHDTGDGFELSVTDTGVGIPASERSHVFERFYSSAQKNGYIGTGIGLNLAHMLVELHGGSIAVADNPHGKGTMFTVAMPKGLGRKDAETAAEGHEDDIAAAETATQAAPIATEQLPKEKLMGVKHRNLLIVEDDTAIRQYVHSELSSDFVITECGNGQEAWDYVQKNADRVDLIVTDLMMPVMDGLQLCQKLKANFLTSHIPVLMLTAKTDDSDYIEGIRNGADYYLTKPFNIDVLRSAAMALLRARQLQAGRQTVQTFEEEKIDDLDVVSADERLMERIAKVINANMSNPDLNIEFIADKVGISRVHFHRKMKELTGQTPRDFLKGIRLKQAAKLLASKRLDITDVSIATGFKSISTFSTSFKSIYGMTPSEYMRSNEGK